jgi:hypothetical protein
MSIWLYTGTTANKVLVFLQGHGRAVDVWDDAGVSLD